MSRQPGTEPSATVELATASSVVVASASASAVSSDAFAIHGASASASFLVGHGAAAAVVPLGWVGSCRARTVLGLKLFVLCLAGPLAKHADPSTACLIVSC